MSDLISKEKAIEQMSLYGSVWMEYTDNMTREQIAEQALRASKRELIEVVKQLPSVHPEPHWIPVTERLPDDSRNVLITSRGGVSMAWYNGSYFEKGANTHHRKMQTVTAWCELPEPYKGVTE